MDSRQDRKAPAPLAGIVTPPPHDVRLNPAAVTSTEDEALWSAIDLNADSMCFKRYKRFIDWCMGCGDDPKVLDERLVPGENESKNQPPASNESEADLRSEFKCDVKQRMKSVYPIEFRGTASYDALKGLTELFVRYSELRGYEADARLNLDLYLTEALGGLKLLPYQKEIRDRLAEYLVKNDPVFMCGDGPVSGQTCSGPLRSRLEHPNLIELIWNYWHEEAMVTQTLKIVAVQFQNRALPAGYTPITSLQIDCLRPMSNFLWGWVQDEVNRLSVSRRAHEYHHQYGLSLAGRAVRGVRPSETRSRFLQAFHELLHKTSVYYEQYDEMTRRADAFPVLNALRELHVILAEGAHNQFTDLTVAARAEGLMEMWLLARPEMREFFGRRIAVPYPEQWMDRVDTMKSLQRWSDTSVTQFHYLADFGERILLGVRYGNWMNEHNQANAANWAIAWRSAVQNYVHAYHAVTGVNLAAREVRAAPVDTTLPSVHLARRIESRRRELPAPGPANGFAHGAARARVTR